jgi:hypothetical protein
MKRRLKQLAYLLLFVGFWVLVLALVYISFFKPAPSCFDGVQNQNEEGLDCGGICRALCVQRDLVPPSALGAPQVFTPSDQLISVLLELKNPNQGTGIRQLPYSVRVQGAQGTPLEIKGVTSLYAGEVRRLVLVRPVTTNAKPYTAALTLGTSTVQWAPAEQFRKPDIDIVNAVTTSTAEGIRTEGTVTSNDALPVTDVAILGLFYDTAGNLIGASQTLLPRLQGGESTRFTIAYPALPNIDTNATQVSVSAYRP